MNLERKDINTLGIQLQEIKYHFSSTKPKGEQPHHFLQLKFKVKYFLKQAFCFLFRGGSWAKNWVIKSYFEISVAKLLLFNVMLLKFQTLSLAKEEK